MEAKKKAPDQGSEARRSWSEGNCENYSNSSTATSGFQSDSAFDDSKAQNYDFEHLTRAITLLAWNPDVCMELRILSAREKANGRKIPTISGYFTSKVEMCRGAMKWSGKAEGIYVVLNPITPRVRFRAFNRLEEWAKHTTSDDEILRRRWLLVDLDPERPAGVSSTDKQHEAALSRAHDVYNYLIRVKKATKDDLVLADSGNGGHVLLRVDYPNDDAYRDRCKGFLAKLGEKFTDDRVAVDDRTFNASRLCKLYGTLACKGDRHEENPHRMARILEAPPCR